MQKSARHVATLYLVLPPLSLLTRAMEGLRPNPLRNHNRRQHLHLRQNPRNKANGKEEDSGKFDN